MNTVVIYTDGGCHGNPGPGGWAFVAQESSSSEADARYEQCGGEPLTTNNRMELDAVIKALEWAGSRSIRPDRVIVRTDSQYVRNGITSWIHTWMKNGWKTAAKAPVKNQERWQRLHELDRGMSVAWEWVRGHAGDELNERCDSLVQRAIAELD